MIDRKLFIKIIMGIVGVILLFVIIPKFNFSTKSSKPFGVLNKGSKTVALPASLKWGSDFNYNYKKSSTSTSGKSKSDIRKARFDHFKNKK